MAFADWVFYTRVTENVVPSNIQLLGETAVPLVGTKSLRIQDLGAPNISTVAFLPNPLIFDTRIEVGRMRTIFFKDAGLGFEDQGIWFLSSGTNPLHDEVQVYAVHYSSGSSTVRVSKFLNGLHDNSSVITLTTYTVPFTGSEPIVFQVSWEGGLLARYHSYTKISVEYGSNTVNFGDLVPLVPIVTHSVNPLFTGIGPGLFVRSRNTAEPLDSLIDSTSIYRSNVA